MQFNFKHILLLASILFTALACKKDKVGYNYNEIRDYLFISHTRTDVNPIINDAAQSIDYSKYDILMMGGDLASLSSENSGALDYLDQFYNLASPTTLWALGNHDYSNIALLTSYTQRPTYYAYYEAGITYLVIDTQVDDCSIVGAQKMLFDQVTDTISASSHLIIIHHKLIWMESHPILHNEINNISNGPAGTCNFCIFPNNYNAEIYPKLVQVQQSGIRVICIGGDIGFNVNEFEFTTGDGIVYLASGMNHLSPVNKVLTFQHSPSIEGLIWQFDTIQ